MRHLEEPYIKFVQDRAGERITEIFDAIGVEYTERHDYIHSACPVHDGDNDRGLFWAMQSNHWQCKTRGCHKEPTTGPSSSVFGLVRGAMGRKTGKKWTFPDAVLFVSQVLGIDQGRGDYSAQDIEIAKIIKEYKRKRSKDKSELPLLSTMLPLLTSDNVYYPERGVDNDIIAKYHISFCNKKGKPMYNRAFFPVLDVSGRYVVGWSGRSIHEKCDKCNGYHEKQKGCPDKQHAAMSAKWRHSGNFQAENCLYNIWYAKPFISKTGTAIVCEGPGDVWAYESAGIHNSVAIFGLSMSKNQRLLLQNSGALTLILTFDNDESGRKAMEKIESEFINYFRIICVTPDNANDIGGMMSDDIADKINPIVSKMSKKEILNNT